MGNLMIMNGGNIIKMNLEKNIRKIGKIVGRGLAVGGLLVALSGFADANLPKVHADQLKSVWYNIAPPGISIKNCVYLGYDTNQDNQPDMAFTYELSRPNAFAWEEKTDLVGYAHDLNKDGEFNDDEWAGYTPVEKDSNDEKENLLEVNPEGLVTHVWNLPCKGGFSNNALDLGYDTNGDGLEDARFFYNVQSNSISDHAIPDFSELQHHWETQTITPLKNMEAVANLVSYIIDSDLDGFDENEWFEYKPEEKNGESK